MQYSPKNGNERKIREQAVPALAAKAFKDVCLRRHGDLLRAWRIDLDPEMKCVITWNELMQGCSRLGYQGNRKLLWCDLAGVGPLDGCTGLLTVECSRALVNQLVRFRIDMIRNFLSVSPQT